MPYRTSARHTELPKPTSPLFCWEDPALLLFILLYIIPVVVYLSIR